MSAAKPFLMLLQRLRRLLKQKKRGSMMVVILKENPDSERIADLTAWLESLGLEVHPTVGKVQTILGLVGDTSKVDIELIRALDIVQDVKRISQPYKEANRAFHPDNTVVTVGDASSTSIKRGCKSRVTSLWNHLSFCSPVLYGILKSIRTGNIARFPMPSNF